MAKLFIICGHGAGDPGCCAGGCTEAERVRALGQQAQRELAEQFDRIDEIAAFNTEKVLAAFQKHKVAESFFQGTTGYGYDDLGREALGEI